MGEATEWFEVANVDAIDTPALVVFPDRIRENIRLAISMAGDASRLRPHVKTHKSPQVSKLMLDAGLRKFKCATIAEAEMLAQAGADDILLAYQPVGPKALRLADLAAAYPATRFSALVDDANAAAHLSETFVRRNLAIPVYIDLNVGMNRTGIAPSAAEALADSIRHLRGLEIAGLHAYDGHIRDSDMTLRRKKCDEAFAPVRELKDILARKTNREMKVITGGTPTFSIHCARPDIECSPGTFVYWDQGYSQSLSEQKFNIAAVVVSRVISKPAQGIICTDLGHKAIASENPIHQRVYFLNAPDLVPVGHSEEHMVFESKDSYDVGDVLYGIPHHICPTVALHDQVVVVEKGKMTDRWSNISRNRKITI